jgi:SulP family sulfate permease
MFIVVLGTFEWASLRLFGRVPKADVFVAILVTVVTVMTDLAIAVIVGVIVSALVFAWEHAKQMFAKTWIDDQGSKHYVLNGPLFFGSVHAFNNLFDPKNDPDDVIVDFASARVYDHSGLEAIDSVAERYVRAGKSLHLKHLSEECHLLLKKAGDLVEVNVIEDPHYHVAVDGAGKLIKKTAR